MLFNSLDYALFLALALAGYWTLARSVRTRFVRLAFVLVASCIFYAAWNPWYLGLILFSTLVDWVVARNIGRTEHERARKRWLSVSVVLNLGLLATFKYFDFAATSLQAGLDRLGVQVELPLLRLALPVGISFYTFESLSYCIDVYRRKCAPARTPLELLFFITFFPKLVAGPIARPADLLPQLEREPRLTPRRVGEAFFLIGTGLVKKVAFADFLSVNLVDRVFDAPDGYTASEVVVALYGFTLQIYMDFSGYTDIARGSAQLFGIELPENFDRPYQASNPAEFWRRWHMTLSTWLRDYLYFPLGGSRLGERRTYVNLWITIFLIGLWHGASWTFVLYGAIQASAVVLHRFISRRRQRHARAASDVPGSGPSWTTVLAVFGTMQFVVFSRILFRADSLENARAVVGRLASGTWGLANVAPWVWAAIVVGFAAHYTPRRWYEAARDGYARWPAVVQGFTVAVVLAVLMQIAASETVPYIYFQF